MEIIGVVCIIIGIILAIATQQIVHSISDRTRIDHQNKMAENEMYRGIRIRERMQKRIDKHEREGNHRMADGLRRALKYYSENHDDAGNRIQWEEI